MQALLEEALEAGAIGLSTGTFYPPAREGDAPRRSSRSAGRSPRAARLYVTHMRDEASTGDGGARRDLPHRPRARHPGGGVAPQGAEQGRTSAARRRRCPSSARRCSSRAVCLDCYPYTAGSTMIRTDRGMLDGRVLIASSVPHPECAGRDLGDIAAGWGVEEGEAARRLQPGTAIYFLMDEDDVQRILAFDDTMIGSDGIPVGEKPHPRLWGTFPRVLGHYSRDVGAVPARDRGLEDDRPDGAQLRPRRPRHASPSASTPTWCCSTPRRCATPPPTRSRPGRPRASTASSSTAASPGKTGARPACAAARCCGERAAAAAGAVA